MEYRYIEWESEEGLITLWLNRPEKRNAFDHQMISELNDALQRINLIEDDMIVILRGRGEVFCGGADLNWMQAAADLDYETNYQECLHLTQCLYNLYSCQKVTIAIVHGAAYGGGVGLAAACDMAFCADESKFSLSELRMGLVASTISPYVLKKLGESRTKELIFTGFQFGGKDAETFGLVTRSVPSKELDSIVHEYLSFIYKGGSKARSLSKHLIHELSPAIITLENIEKTARLLAEVRVSDEAQHRIKSYLNKVKS